MKNKLKIDLLLAFMILLPVFEILFYFLLCSLPVHAAESWILESNSKIYDITRMQYNADGSYMAYYVEHLYCNDSNNFYGLVGYEQNNTKLFAVRFYSLSSGTTGTFTGRWVADSYSIQNNEPQFSFSRERSGFYNFGLDYFSMPQGDYKTDMPVFKDMDSFISYCQTGDKSGLISDSDFDPHDDAYAFTGFSMSGKTATWTGTTERSYLLDVDVNEYVNFTYGFATSEDQEVSSFIDAEAQYPTSDKKLALPWDEMEAKKKDGEFIRQVNIIPCYGASGAGFYYGLPCKIFYHKNGSIDKVELPTSNGILSSDMERPVIVLNEASNGNPVGGDYSYFRFNNAQDDYFIEMKGRWYTTNDFDIYRENLVWKYKYQTILKNELSSWVSVSDSVNSVGTFRFDVLGKSSWESLLSLYPVDNRNFEGGSFALFNKITGYSDALDTLKMLLKQPYSLYNGYEIYVRYYRYDDNGNLQYSKWTHFYNNLANAAGSSGSRLDDLDNMYSENQSDKGLTDDELSDLENTGNSRNDLDAVPKNNYDYSSLENATMNFFDLLTNYGSMLGQFPSMVAAVFGFLPPWLIGFIALGIGAVIVCRFIGR